MDMKEENFNLEELELLKRVPIFGALLQEELEELLSQMSIQSVKKGDRIFLQNSSPENIYIIKRGEVSLEFEKYGKIYHLRKYLQGDCFGHLALLAIKPQLGTSIAIEDTQLYTLSKYKFHALTKTNNRLFSKLLLNIARESSRYNYILVEALVEKLEKSSV